MVLDAMDAAVLNSLSAPLLAEAPKHATGDSSWSAPPRSSLNGDAKVRSIWINDYVVEYWDLGGA